MTRNSRCMYCRETFEHEFDDTKVCPECEWIGRSNVLSNFEISRRMEMNRRISEPLDASSMRLSGFIKSLNEPFP